MGYKTIRIRDTTHDNLKQRGRYGESMDDIINNLIDQDNYLRRINKVSK